MLSRQRFPIDDNHTDNSIVAANTRYRLFSLILGHAIVIERSGQIFFRIKTVTSPVKHKVCRQMDQSAPLMLATIRQVLYRRHVNGIRLLTVLLAIIRDGKSRTIDNDIRTDMVEQGLHRRIVVDVQPNESMGPFRTDIRMKGTAEYFAGPVLRKVIQDSSPDKPISTYNQYLFHQNI